MEKPFQKIEKAYLVGIDLGDNDCQISMEELKDLVKTAGGEVFDYAIQKRNSIDPKICIGYGKLMEIKQIIEENEIDLVIFDVELTASQTNNISDLLNCPVIDRTILILDIFALRAKSSEGKLQVELAQLKHRYNNLKGLGKSLSRLGGGIGTRGPGETKLETDRRHIRRRMDKLQQDLEEYGKHRTELRKNRSNKNYKTVSLVGYTNAGKSTLLNSLTNSNAYVKEQLFATLDTTSRLLKIDNKEIILTDTVGFIRKLPHFLINAFKSTLEEVVLSDLVLLVIDSSDNDFENHEKITREILDELGYNNKILKVYNKCDLISKEDCSMLDGITISALSEENFFELKKAIYKTLFGEKVNLKLKIPYQDAKAISSLRKKGVIVSEKFEDTYEILEIYIDLADSLQYNKYIISEHLFAYKDDN
ncbi:MAG: GTPase HflX [Clostridia bacterium]|nr:GTPase HflX [Clostridia bacterium]